jgi:hypothetical protein
LRFYILLARFPPSFGLDISDLCALMSLANQ